MFMSKFPDLPQPPTAGHILDSCSLTLHGKTLSYDLRCHVLIGQECEPGSYAEYLLLNPLTPRSDKNITFYFIPEPENIQLLIGRLLSGVTIICVHLNHSPVQQFKF